MKRLSSLLVTLVAFSILVSSCATIFTGTRDHISFESTPSGATVYLDGVELCKTPCSQEIKRSLSKKSVEFRLDGYKTRFIVLDREFNLVSVLNLTSPFGWAIDMLTGSIYNYDRKHYYIQMEEKIEKGLSKTKEIRIDTEKKEVEIVSIAQNK